MTDESGRRDKRTNVEIIEEARIRAEQQEARKLLEQLQLPLWPDEFRAVPNGLLRSALFAAIQPGARRYIEEERIASLEGIEIIYTGQQLDQGDLSLWECALHLARLQELGNKCNVSTYQILKLLGKTDSGGNRRLLNKRLTRLRATALNIKQGRYTYIGGLIDEAARDDETGQMAIVISPRIVALFQSDQYTQTQWSLRQDLTRPLAQWLHGFYASHAKPHPITIKKIHTLCGTKSKSLKDFKNQTLTQALDELSKVSAKHGQRFNYQILNGLLHVDKSVTPSQRRHLLK
jgi:hypothetical protein